MVAMVFSSAHLYLFSVRYNEKCFPERPDLTPTVAFKRKKPGAGPEVRGLGAEHKEDGRNREEPLREH